MHYFSIFSDLYVVRYLGKDHLNNIMSYNHSLKPLDRFLGLSCLVSQLTDVIAFIQMADMSTINIVTTFQPVFTADFSS